MNQPKKNHSKAKVVKDDHLSSSDDEMKPVKVGKNRSGNSRAKKTSEKKKPQEKGSKDSKKSQVDGKYTDIKMNSYVCKVLTDAPRDAHIVDIDTYGVCCQLWEMYKAKSQMKQNVSQKKSELFAVLCSALAILENIVLGVRYSDIPTMVVDMFPRTRVLVRSDYMEAVHACSIPKGKVYIGRGNKSVGCLAAFIEAVNPSAVQDNEALKTLETKVVNILTNRGFDSPIVIPPEGQDTCLNEYFKIHGGTKYTANDFVVQLRNIMLEANAAVADEDDYHLYVPVLCEQSEICYLIGSDDDVQLVSFMPITNESTLKRLKIYAMSFRFFITYVRVMKENKNLVDAEEVENDMLGQGYVPIFEKHGMMMLRKRMDEEGSGEEESVLVEADVSVPAAKRLPGQMERVAFNFESNARLVCYNNVKHMTRLEVKGFVGKRIRVSNDGMVEMETDKGYVFTMLASKQRSGSKAAKDCWFGKLPDIPERKWSAWAKAGDASAVETWVNGLPDLPKNW